MSDSAAVGMEVVRSMVQRLHSARASSLVEYSKPVRVEPVTLVDMRAGQLPQITSILHTTLNIFAGYYALAIDLSINVDGISVLQLFDQLIPQRDPFTAMTSSALRAGEFGQRMEQRIALENRQALLFDDENLDTLSQEDPDGSNVNDPSKSMTENYNLAVGKLLDVNVSDKNARGQFKIMMRLRTQEIRPQILVDTMALDKGVEDSLWKQFKERFHGWRSGQLRFVKDILFAQDLIEKHRKNLMNDETGYYRARREDRKRNELAGLLSGRPSVASASSIFVMTTQTARELERKTRSSLDRFKDREHIFKQTEGMLMVVIDPDWEIVTIYHRSIEEPTEVAMGELQKMQKKGGPDIMEILSAFRQSRTPTV